MEDKEKEKRIKYLEAFFDGEGRIFKKEKNERLNKNEKIEKG
jgi:hypothetical protein